MEPETLAPASGDERTATEPETLKNHIGGAWVESAATETIDDIDPATGRILARVPLSTTADVDAAARAARAAQPDWAAVPVDEAGPRRLRAPRGARQPPRRADPARHRGHGQGARRRPRRGRPRHRVDRGRLRGADADEGREPRGRRDRRRRRDVAAAGRRRRRDHPVQLPGDDPALVPPLRDRLREHVHPQAVGARPAHAAADRRAGRRDRGDPGRRGQHRPRRPRRGRTASSTTPRSTRSASSARRRPRST